MWPSGPTSTPAVEPHVRPPGNVAQPVIVSGFGFGSVLLMKSLAAAGVVAFVAAASGAGAAGPVPPPHAAVATSVSATARADPDALIACLPRITFLLTAAALTGIGQPPGSVYGSVVNTMPGRSGFT
jgi:hypothetical protein